MIAFDMVICLVLFAITPIPTCYQDPTCPSRKNLSATSSTQMTTSITNNLRLQARDAFRRKDFAESAIITKKALELQEQNLGADHPEVAKTLQVLADALVLDHKIAEAEPILKRSLTIVEKIKGPNEQSLIGALRALAHLHIGQGKVLEAEPLLKRALVIAEKTGGSGCVARDR